ncbi:hypothetical protein [Actinoplanes xinjiangensis]|uniref:hypothetical protein n=1 Tax=Actinoplanes xinjiangensis TaxID=512350 RepID=UPI00343C9918
MSTGEPIAECTEIDGLFTDLTFPVEPVFERYTLLRGEPSGRLRAVVDSGGPASDGSGRLDIELEGHREPDTANDGGTVAPDIPN